MKIPFVDLKAQYQSIKKEIDAAVENVINETAFIGGTYVKQFESEFAALYGVNHVVSCANGTDSLYIIMKMLAIGSGDEVITVANSWISSSETIGQTGATPIFVDIDEEYHSMNLELFEQAITPKTKAVIMVHLQGQAVDLDKVEAICKERNIYLIEDCAQSHFTEYKGRRAGTVGIAGSFSFYPGKNLGAYGDAGCIITNDEDFANKCRMFATHGALTKHQHQIEGINSRMDGLQAAILSAKLPHILDWTSSRIEKAKWYESALKGIPQLVLPSVRPNSKHTFHLYVIRAQRRDELASYLKENGIETAIHYPTPLPLLPAYAKRGFTGAQFPVASKYQYEILSLPIYPELTLEQVQYIKVKIAAFYSND
jgi:dTDP-4-amino-4,6-dideoxygalactose transaminase